MTDFEIEAYEAEHRPAWLLDDENLFYFYQTFGNQYIEYYRFLY